MHNHRQIIRLRRAATALLISTLLVRALLPLGYMPGNLLDGKFAELCPVASAATYSLLAAHDSHQHQHGDQDDAGYSMDSACPIGSSLFSDALPVLYSDFEAELPLREFAPAPATSSFVARQLRTYPARAPPHS